VHDVEAALPQRAQARRVAVLVERAGIANLDPRQQADRDRSGVEPAEHVARVEVMVGHDGLPDAVLGRRRGVSQRRDEDAGLPFPVEALSRGWNATGDEQENEGKEGLPVRLMDASAKHIEISFS